MITQTLTTNNTGIDPNYFYWVPTQPTTPFNPIYPVYPAPVCPGCGRCPSCGRQAQAPIYTQPFWQVTPDSYTWC